MKKIIKIFLITTLALSTLTVNAQEPQNVQRLTGFVFVEEYLSPQNHQLMLGYAFGLVNGFNKGLTYEGKHLVCNIPPNFTINDIGNAITISIAANKHLQREYIDDAVLEGFALSFCEKAGEQT